MAKIPEGLKEFRALVIRWTLEEEGGKRMIMMEAVAEQVDPLDLFLLEVTDETQETFARLRPALQFAFWIFRNDVEWWDILRGKSISKVAKRVVAPRREESGQFGQD